MSASADADKEGRKVFLGGLAYESSEDDLRNDFGKYGELEDIQLPMGDGGKHKGFAFLTFRQPDDASYAVKQHHQRPYMGREISAKIVIPRAERTGGGEVSHRSWIKLSGKLCSPPFFFFLSAFFSLALLVY